MVRRDCALVITEMLELIPKEKTELISKLEWNKEDAMYKAPEESIQWFRTSETLQEYILEPKEDWEFKVLSIFSTLSVEDIKEEIRLSKIRAN